MTLDWYFDFISPFAYLQWQRLDEVPSGVTVRPQPVLFAAMLRRWGQLGPAEIEPKRRFTYRHVTWLAARAAVPFTLPTGHPFNSLPLLRLAWTLGPTRAIVDRLFRYVWVDGHVPQDGEPWRRLLTDLGVPDYAESAAAKDRLRAATDEALGRGVFGVPTAAAGTELFWGYDATDMLLEYCRDPAMLTTDAMRRVDALPVAAARPGAKSPG